MAELSGLARQTFCDLFLKRYNQVHKAVYTGEPEERPHEDWDYRWSLKGHAPLLVQHTRASSNELEERAKRALAGQWAHDEIHRHLLDALPKGMQLEILVHRLPTKTSDRWFMGEMIRGHVLDGARAHLSIGERRILTPFAERGGIAELALKGIDPIRRAISVDGPPFQFDHDKVAARGIEAVQKKQARLGPRPSQVVLAIFFDLTPYGPPELREMRAALRGQQFSFREIWTVNPWQPGARGDRLWPK